MSKFFPLHLQKELPNDSPINSPVSLLSTWVSSQRRPLALRSSPTFPSFAASPIKRKGDEGRFPRHLPRHLKFRTWRMLHGDVGLQPPHRLRKPELTLSQLPPTDNDISANRNFLGTTCYKKNPFIKVVPRKSVKFPGTTFVPCFLRLGQHRRNHSSTQSCGAACVSVPEMDHHQDQCFRMEVARC